MRVSTTRHRGAKAIDIGSWITLRWQWSVDDIARVASLRRAEACACAEHADIAR
jgi:hypothetical protein